MRTEHFNILSSLTPVALNGNCQSVLPSDLPMGWAHGSSTPDHRVPTLTPWPVPSHAPPMPHTPSATCYAGADLCYYLRLPTSALAGYLPLSIPQNVDKLSVPCSYRAARNHARAPGRPSRFLLGPIQAPHLAFLLHSARPHACAPARRATVIA